MKNILVIYNLIPDETFYFSVPADHPDIETIKGAHGAFINVSDPTPEQQLGYEYLNDASSTNENYCTRPENVGKIKQYEVSEESLKDSEFSGVIVCNFYC